MSCYITGETWLAIQMIIYYNVVTYRLHQVFADMTYQEKDKLIHLSRSESSVCICLVSNHHSNHTRWFRNLQQNAKLRRGKPLVAFSRTKLY